MKRDLDLTMLEQHKLRQAEQAQSQQPSNSDSVLDIVPGEGLEIAAEASKGVLEAVGEAAGSVLETVGSAVETVGEAAEAVGEVVGAVAGIFDIF